MIIPNTSNPFQFYGGMMRIIRDNLLLPHVTSGSELPDNDVTFGITFFLETIQFPYDFLITNRVNGLLRFVGFTCSHRRFNSSTLMLCVRICIY